MKGDISIIVETSKPKIVAVASFLITEEDIRDSADAILTLLWRHLPVATSKLIAHDLGLDDRDFRTRLAAAVETRLHL